MKKKININMLLIGAVLLVAGAMFAFRGATAQKGATAVVRIDGTDKRQEISLEEDNTYFIEDGKIRVTLEVKDGRIRFVNSLCPDHLCEGFGFISYEDETAICMPAGVAVLITEAAD